MFICALATANIQMIIGNKCSVVADAIKDFETSYFLAGLKMKILKGQQLLRKTGVVVDADEALQGKKIICFYFSALWCPPCKAFTPILADFYQVIIVKMEFMNG